MLPLTIFVLAGCGGPVQVPLRLLRPIPIKFIGGLVLHWLTMVPVIPAELNLETFTLPVFDITQVPTEALTTKVFVPRLPSIDPGVITPVDEFSHPPPIPVENT